MFQSKNSYILAIVSFSAYPPDTGKHLTAIVPRKRCAEHRTVPYPPLPSSAFGWTKQWISSQSYNL